jgi:predicted Na+-dependent transporter
MSYLPSIAVLLLMLSTGMSLNWRQFVENWRKLALGAWARLLLVTFILPPVMVLLLAQVLPMNGCGSLTPQHHTNYVVCLMTT